MRYATTLIICCLIIDTFALPVFGQKPNQDTKETPVFDEYPDTIAGRRAAKFIRAFNSESKDEIEQYLEEHMSPDRLKQQPLDQLVPAFVSIKQQLGELEVKAIEEKSNFSIVVKAKARKSGGWLDIIFSVDKEEPHYQQNLGLAPGRAPSANNYEQWKDLPDLLTQLREETKAPSIAIAIVKNGEIYQSSVSGVRQLGDSSEAQISDRYHVGSVGKSMTAVMIGKLIEEKKIDWDTTISEVLEDIEMKDDYRDVTVEQLMRHRGGIHPFVDDRQFDRAKFIDQSLSPGQQRIALVKDALAREPIAEAGTSMNYSNAGYVILGVMAEQRTGKSFEKLISEYIFKPLKFESAGFGWPRTLDRSDQPAGHGKMGSRIQIIDSAILNMGHCLVPAGEMHLSIEDLAKYAAFHLNGLSEKPVMLHTDIVKRLHEPPVDGSYAAGWMIREAPDGSPLHFHNGSIVCFYAAVALFPEHNAAVVVATNLGMDVEADILKAVDSIFEKEIRKSADSDQ